MKTWTRVAGAMLVAVASCVPGSQANALIVFDPSNYTQNVVQAARALQQINQQIQSLQNQATMILSMAKNLDRLNLSSLTQMTTSLQQISALMSKAQGISYGLGDSERRFQALFPGRGSATTTTSAFAAAQARLTNELSSLSHSVSVQSNIVTTVGNDAAVLATLVDASQSAHGNLQAQQASSQLMALVAKQQMQLETLMAAQSRADGVARAADVQTGLDSQAQMKRFLGTGHAYP